MKAIRATHTQVGTSSVEVQSMLLTKRFLFFPPGESALISFGHLSYGGILFMKGEAKLPPSTPNVFNVQFHRLQNMKTKKLEMKAIRATHMQIGISSVEVQLMLLAKRLIVLLCPCIPFRLFKATLQRIAANLRAGCAFQHTRRTSQNLASHGGVLLFVKPPFFTYVIYSPSC